MRMLNMGELRRRWAAAGVAAVMAAALTGAGAAAARAMAPGPVPGLVPATVGREGPGGDVSGKAGATQPARAILERAVVIGASVSDGFMTSVRVKLPAEGGEAEKQVERRVAAKMANVLRAAAAPADEQAEVKGPESLATGAFFSAADRIAERQVNEALAAKPEVVFAVDYLFWHAYGVMPEEERAAMFDRGLQRVERMLAAGATVVIGDVPNMSHAAPGMLSPPQVPSAEMHRQLNARLAEWAKGRRGVHVLGLAELVRAARAGEAVTMGGRLYGPAEAAKLLQRDGLHATGAGLTALAQEALATLEAAGVVAAGSWERDPEKVLAALRPMPRAARPAGGPGAPAAPKSEPR
ncbi:MAG: hypothetical protein LW650_11575 [Planctomycetaceae bacterium]|nr:hypothetical protein [Planctomycetaceae bacterium]